MTNEDNRAFERHYTLRQIAELWNVHYETVRRLFEHEPGVVRINTEREAGASGVRRYTRRVVPESVVFRVHRRISEPEKVKPAGIVPAGGEARNLRGVS